MINHALERVDGGRTFEGAPNIGNAIARSFGNQASCRRGAVFDNARTAVQVMASDDAADRTEFVGH